MQRFMHIWMFKMFVGKRTLSSTICRFGLGQNNFLPTHTIPTQQTCWHARETVYFPLFEGRNHNINPWQMIQNAQKILLNKVISSAENFSKPPFPWIVSSDFLWKIINISSLQQKPWSDSRPVPYLLHRLGLHVRIIVASNVNVVKPKSETDVIWRMHSPKLMKLVGFFRILSFWRTPICCCLMLSGASFWKGVWWCLFFQYSFNTGTGTSNHG